MGYPNQYPPQPGGQGGYPAQPGYGQPQGYAPQAPQGYAPGAPAGYGQPPADVATAFDFGQLYGQADPGAGGIEKGTYPSIVESAEFDRTRDGTKWAWTVVVRISVEPYINRKMTKTLSINPTKRDGTPNPAGLGITFRQVHALGVPLGPPIGQQGETPVWQQVPQQGTPDQIVAAAGRLAAQMMTGRPCRIVVGIKAADGEYGERPEMTDIMPPKPGDPTSLPQQAAQNGQPAYGPSGFAPPQGYQATGMPPAPQGGYAAGAQGAPPQGYAQPGVQPVGPAAAPPWGGQPQQAAPQAPAPYGAPPGTFPGQVSPGAPGTGQFTPQGQAQQWVNPAGQPVAGPSQAQPAVPQAPWDNGQPQAAPPQGQPQPPQQAAPPAPPWQQPQQ